MTTNDDRGTVAEIMRETDIAVLTYQSLAGALVSTPMGMQDFEDPGTIWFITERSSDKGWSAVVKGTVCGRVKAASLMGQARHPTADAPRTAAGGDEK